MKMKRLYFFGLFVFFIVNGCVTMTLPPLMSGNPAGVAKERWSDYGAVYEYDELRIHTEDLDADQGWNSFYYINQKLHILTLKGVKYGTVKVHKYGDTLSDFKVTLWDPAGNEVPLNLDELRKKYSETGIIIVPKVEPGCQIGINLVFRKANLIYSYEHWFERQIPVINGRFSLFYPADVKYTCKTYGSVAPVKRQRAGVCVGYIWDKNNILPEDDVFENRWHIAQEPHIMARLDHWSFMHINYNASDWKGLARQYKEYFLSPSIFTSRSTIKKIANSAIHNQKSSFEKADAILEYIQDEITLNWDKKIDLNAIDLNKVLRDKSGDPFEIAVLLKEMFKAAGFSTHVYVTQPHHIGGFDPEFPTWRYLDSPLVAIDLDGKELIAYPYSRLMGLGEYPFAFHDLQALDIENGTIAFLPKSIHADAKRQSLATLSPKNWEDTHTWQFIYGGRYATFMRKRMSSRTPNMRKEFFRSVIRDYDKENSLKNADLETINRQEDIKISLECQNTSFKTEGAGASHYFLKPWFRKYFTDYDKSRKAKYTNDMVLVYEDSVFVEKNNNARQTYHFECANLDNSLFSARCEQTDTDRGMLLSRKLTVKQADLTPAQMQSIYPDIVALNRIDESFMVEKH